MEGGVIQTLVSYARFFKIGCDKVSHKQHITYLLEQYSHSKCAVQLLMQIQTYYLTDTT